MYMYVRRGLAVGVCVCICMCVEGWRWACVRIVMCVSLGH